MSALPLTQPDEVTEPLMGGEARAADVLRLVPAHEHTWALRDTEYDNGLTFNRFECDSCSAVRFT